LKSNRLDDKPEIRLGIMLVDYPIVPLRIWVGKRLGYPEGWPVRQLPLAVDEIRPT
jgi:hypothetical protein